MKMVEVQCSECGRKFDAPDGAVFPVPSSCCFADAASPSWLKENAAPKTDSQYWHDATTEARVLRCCAEELENKVRSGLPFHATELIAWYIAQADNRDPDGKVDCSIVGCNYVTLENQDCVRCGKPRPSTKPLLGRSPIGVIDVALGSTK